MRTFKYHCVFTFDVFEVLSGLRSGNGAWQLYHPVGSFPVGNYSSSRVYVSNGHTSQKFLEGRQECG
jgi:hypothetical protein